MHNYFCTFHTDGLEALAVGDGGHLEAVVDPSGAEAPEEEGTVLFSPTLAY